MVQTINNPDGTVSIIQIDTGPNSVVTLPDGTQATVVHSMTAVSVLKLLFLAWRLLTVLSTVFGPCPTMPMK